MHSLIKGFIRNMVYRIALPFWKATKNAIRSGGDFTVKNVVSKHFLKKLQQLKKIEFRLLQFFKKMSRNELSYDSNQVVKTI